VLADINVTRSLQRGLNELVAFVPELIGAIVVLALGYIVAKVIGKAVWRGTHHAGLDRTLHGGYGGSFIRKITASPSRLIGRIAFWAVFLGAVALAVSVLGIDALSDFVAAIFSYLPNVLAALLIFLVAGAVAAGVAALARRMLGDTALGKVVGTAVPVVVMAIAGFMILEQLEIAPEIVRITYAALMGAVALGFALAFGLGGRDVAARMLENAYAKGQERSAEFRRDLDQGMTRAKEDAERAREKVEEDADEEPSVTPASSRPAARRPGPSAADRELEREMEAFDTEVRESRGSARDSR
jgi:Conserved TM helix